jgi:hypothetical protein
MLSTQYPPSPTHTTFSYELTGAFFFKYQFAVRKLKKILKTLQINKRKFFLFQKDLQIGLERAKKKKKKCQHVYFFVQAKLQLLNL